MPPTLSQTSKLDSLPLSLTWRLLLNTALSPRPEVLWYDIMIFLSSICFSSIMIHATRRLQWGGARSMVGVGPNTLL